MHKSFCVCFHVQPAGSGFAPWQMPWTAELTLCVVGSTLPARAVSSGAARAGRFLAQNAVACPGILWEIRMKYSCWFPWVWDRVPPELGCDVLNTWLNLMLELNAQWELLSNNPSQPLFLPDHAAVKSLICNLSLRPEVAMTNTSRNILNE